MFADHRPFFIACNAMCAHTSLFPSRSSPFPFQRVTHAFRAIRLCVYKYREKTVHILYAFPRDEATHWHTREMRLMSKIIVAHPPFVPQADRECGRRVRVCVCWKTELPQFPASLRDICIQEFQFLKAEESQIVHIRDDCNICTLYIYIGSVGIFKNVCVSWERILLRYEKCSDSDSA